MRYATGPRGVGLLALLAAFLLPALGVGVANADFNVGDTIILKVPDLSEFPAEIEEHQFTCRAVTEHAYWLVQDTCSVKGSGPGSLDSLVWENLIGQTELDVLTGDFEGNDVDVFGTVTDNFGTIPDTDGDPKVWIVLATIADAYNQDPKDRNSIAYINPDDVDGDTTTVFNNQDIVYINIHTYTSSTAALEIAAQLRMYGIPNGLAMLDRTAVRPTEDLWIVRGLGTIGEYLCYGLTTTDPGNLGLEYCIKDFAKNPGIELTNWQGGGQKMDFCYAKGQEFLWFQYLIQRFDSSIIEDICQSDTTSMVNIGNAMDATTPDDETVQTNVVPIYKDWLICNLVSAFGDDMNGGIYTYDFLEGSYEFMHVGNNAAFKGKFSTYPMDLWIANEIGGGLLGPIWASQYCQFTGDYDADSTVYFNGMFADAGGSGALINGKWEGYLVTTVATSDTTAEIGSITELVLDDLYNGSFTLADTSSYLIVTNNNPNGQADIRYVLSQDTKRPDVLVAAHQNVVNEQYITLYATMMDTIHVLEPDSTITVESVTPEGFDWYGPIFTPITGDSTGLVDMSQFYGTLWNCTFSAWESGNWTLKVAGYDSTGFESYNSIEAAVGFATTGGIELEVMNIRLDIPEGSLAPGTMVSLIESNLLGLAVSSQTTLEGVEGQLTGVLAGPVSFPDVDGLLSFPAENSVASVYRWGGTEWTKVDSYYQGGRMCASVNEGGIYVLGEGPGVSSPEIPAVFRFGGTFPNPFSAEAAINFSLPTTGHVTVTIYDMTGRAVRTLTDTEMQAAEHTLIWDGCDNSGITLGAGVYFCRLESTGHTVTQKMLRVE